VSDQELNDLLKEFDNPHHCYPQSLVDAIRLLVKERDEARREVCQFRSTSYPHDMKEVYEIADSRGWDCFKEGGK
jgi:hypothetical protein